MHKNTNGFTIVELLIVIVVIGILAAIIAVTANGVQDRSRSSTLQGDLSNAKKKLLMYKAEQGTFPVSAATLVNADITANKAVYDTTGNNFYYCRNTLTDEAAVGARTVTAKTSYVISSSGSLRYLSGGVGADQVCQEVGLTGYLDANAYSASGHAGGVGWSSWVK